MGAADRLSEAERRLLVVLGVPNLGLSLSLGVVSTYLPVLARRFTSSRTLLGALVGGEGLIAVLVPLWVGGVSDHVHTRFGRRLPFLLAAAPVAAAALALLPFAPSLLLTAVAVFFYYLAYFTYYAPYRALYPDLVPSEASGRAQGILGVFGAIGLGAALVGGGLLFELWPPLPYLAAAAAVLLVTAAVALGLRLLTKPRAPVTAGARSAPAVLRALIVERRDVRWFAVANALLTLALGGLKAFVVLWLTEGLGKSMSFTAAMMGVVAGAVVVGALVSGRLADRHGTARVMKISLIVFGAGVLLPAISGSTLLMGAAFPVIALTGGAALVLPYALLVRIMPAGSHGAAAGLFDTSSGVGTLLGPAVTGAVIDRLRPVYTQTRGLSAMWLVVSISTLLSVAVLHLGHVGRSRGAP